jgi:threonine aldolase
VTSHEIQAIQASCDRFLRGHHPRTVREHLEALAQSPHAMKPHDMYGSGGFVSELEAEVASMLGKEKAVFMPSGTMAQQIALRIWSDEAGLNAVAYHPTCHLEIHEQMAYRELHHLRAILLGETSRLFTIDDLKPIEPISTLLIELPQREIGGQLPTWDELVAICDYARSQGARLHMDGARLWECRPYYGRSYAEIAAPFDSVYVSCYKILGGLPGAVLAGSAEFIAKARIWQRRHGGNLCQMSSNAISAKMGMDKHLPRMGDYVAKAAEVASVLGGLTGVRVLPEKPPTNMMHLHFAGDPEAITARALQVSKETKVFLFGGLSKDVKLELTVGDAARDIARDEIEDLWGRVLEGVLD